MHRAAGISPSPTNPAPQHPCCCAQSLEKGLTLHLLPICTNPCRRNLRASTGIVWLVLPAWMPKASSWQHAWGTLTFCTSRVCQTTPFHQCLSTERWPSGSSLPPASWSSPHPGRRAPYLCRRQCLSWDLTPPPQVLVHAVHLVHSPHQYAVTSAPSSRLLEVCVRSCLKHQAGWGEKRQSASAPQSLRGWTEGIPCPACPEQTRHFLLHPRSSLRFPSCEKPCIFPIVFSLQVGMKWQYLGFLRKGSVHCFTQLAKPSSQTTLNPPSPLVLSDSRSTVNSGS